MQDSKSLIGIFDSGIGGLSVLKAIQAELPNEELLYLADQAHVPYGARDLNEIRGFSRGIVKYFIDKKVKLIVVACNTASAAALYLLREEFPEIPFVGMEPAIKPAVEKTETKVVGVLATQATFQGELYASVVERFAHDVKLIQDPCVGLVEEIESGDLGGEGSKRILEQALGPMLEANIDTVVLGCTHFPFVFPLIREIVGSNVRLINPAPAVARQVRNVLEIREIINDQIDFGVAGYLTTGEAVKFEEMISSLGFAGEVNEIKWGEDLEI